jgi:membrane protein required for colicin V production
MNWLDLILIILGIISVIGGLKTGIVKSAIPLVGLIAGIFLALHFYKPFSEVLSFIPQNRVAQGVAFALIFIGVLLVTAGLTRLLSWAVSSVMLGWLDHVIGAIWGLLWGAIFITAILAAWVKLFGPAELITKSYIATMLLGRFPSLLAIIPDDFKAVRDFFSY